MGLGKQQGLISLEFDGLLLLKCLNEKQVSSGKGQVTRNTRRGIEVCRVAGPHLAVTSVRWPISSVEFSGEQSAAEDSQEVDKSIRNCRARKRSWFREGANRSLELGVS